MSKFPASYQWVSITVIAFELIAFLKREKTMKRDRSTAILNILIFSIAIMLSCNAFAADTTPRRVTQPEFDAAIVTVNSKISDITPPVRAIGGILPDNSIVFWVDETGQHGLAAQPFDEDGLFDWYVANEKTDSRGPGWHLPTKHELNLLYLQKGVVGGFVDDIYWSSTEVGAPEAWHQDFTDGFQDNKHSGKYDPHNVRAVRAF